MERIDIHKTYEFYELNKIKQENRREMGVLPIHELIVEKYVILLSYYPFGDKKENIFKSLNKSQKMGMLNRKVLSVARELGISDLIIKKTKEITIDLASTKESAKSTSIFFKPDYYKEREKNLRYKLEEYYTLILDMIMEETTKRMDVKYLRKKKLEEITQLISD